MAVLAMGYGPTPSGRPPRSSGRTSTRSSAGRVDVDRGFVRKKMVQNAPSELRDRRVGAIREWARGR
jgi:hypothetical protein